MESDATHLSLRRVNTSRHQTSDQAAPAATRAPSAELDPGTARGLDLPWSPQTGRGFSTMFASSSPLPALHSPRLPGQHNSLPLFQPSPKRSAVQPVSPGGHQLNLALEAMLQSPMYTPGACDILLGGAHDMFRFDTPSSRAFLNESIFSATPRNRVTDAALSLDQKGSGPVQGFTSSQLEIPQLLEGREDKVKPGNEDNADGLAKLHRTGFEAFLQQHQHQHSSQAQNVGQSVLQSQLSEQLLSPGSFFMLGQFNDSVSAADPSTALNQLSSLPYPLQLGDLGSVTLSTIPLDMPLLGSARGLEDDGDTASLLKQLGSKMTPRVENAATASQPAEKSESDYSQGSALPSHDDTGTDAPGSGLKKDKDQGSSTKTCHCKKSQCLKLYCDCFAAGLFCSNCACVSCMNRPEHGGHVMEKRDSIISRDPEAFNRKIQLDDAKQGARHKKGCNCRRSHCLKKYCECFQGGVKCGGHCKCQDCKNVEDPPSNSKKGGRGASAALSARKTAPAAADVISASASGAALAMDLSSAPPATSAAPWPSLWDLMPPPPAAAANPAAHTAAFNGASASQENSRRGAKVAGAFPVVKLEAPASSEHTVAYNDNSNGAQSGQLGAASANGHSSGVALPGSGGVHMAGTNKGAASPPPSFGGLQQTPRTVSSKPGQPLPPLPGLPAFTMPGQVQCSAAEQAAGASQAMEGDQVPRGRHSSMLDPSGIPPAASQQLHATRQARFSSMLDPAGIPPATVYAGSTSGGPPSAHHASAPSDTERASEAWPYALLRSHRQQAQWAEECGDDRLARHDSNGTPGQQTQQQAPPLTRHNSLSRVQDAAGGLGSGRSSPAIAGQPHPVLLQQQRVTPAKRKALYQGSSPPTNNCNTGGTGGTHPTRQDSEYENYAQQSPTRSCRSGGPFGHAKPAEGSQHSPVPQLPPLLTQNKQQPQLLQQEEPQAAGAPGSGSQEPAGIEPGGASDSAQQMKLKALSYMLAASSRPTGMGSGGGGGGRGAPASSQVAIPSHLLDGRLTIKAPTPTMAPQGLKLQAQAAQQGAPSAVAHIHGVATSAAGRPVGLSQCVSPLMGSATSLDAQQYLDSLMMMSPMGLDFDPMQMLSSPPASARLNAMFNTPLSSRHGTSQMQRIGPGSMTLLPSSPA